MLLNLGTLLSPISELPKPTSVKSYSETTLNMTVFVNYDGPKLDRKQKKAVRSQVMVVVRGLQKKQASLKCNARL